MAHRWLSALFCFLFLGAGVGLKPFAIAGEATCKVVADSSIASHPGEQTENTGQSKEVKIKGRENQVIMKFDLTAVPKNSSVTKAALSVKLAKPEFRINQIGYSTVPTDWVEGNNAAAGSPPHGFVCHNWPGPSTKAWGDPGTEIRDVTHGNGGNVNGWVLARKVGERFEIDLPGRVVEAMRVDQPGGLLLMDESGWWGGARSNIYIESRESKKSAPVLRVTWSDERDKTAPSAPKLKALTGDLDDGELLFEITCGGDDDAKGTALGFDLRLLEGGGLKAANWDKAKPVNRYRIPRPKVAGTKIRLWLKDLKPGAAYSVGIVAYDEGGNRSGVTVAEMKATGPTPPPRLNKKPFPFEKGGPLKIGKLQLWSVDELTKIEPVTAKALDGSSYIDHKAAAGNAVWNGKDKKVTLHAARNETVSFRLAVQTAEGQSVQGISLTPEALKGKNDAKIETSQYRLRREWYLKHENNWYGAALPLLNEKAGGVFDVPAKDNKVPGQTVQTIFVELTVPKTTAPGTYQGAINVKAGGDVKGSLPIQLTVHQATLPDTLSYLIELNSYGQGNKDNFYAIHRLAHYFRLGYNTLSYSHSGNQSVPFIPKIEGQGADAKVADWSLWDAWMAPLLDGTLFKDLPRAGVPIPHFYLPFYESYPTPITNEYLGGKIHKARATMEKGEWQFFMCENDVYVADGFSANWKKAAAKIAGEYRKHFEEKGWTKTEFQIFANNKHSKGGTTPTALWTLDEPSFGRDFRAIRFLYQTFMKPFEGSNLNVSTRADVSRPNWQADRLDGGCSLLVSGTSSSWQHIFKRRVHEQGQKYWFYGGRGAPIDDSTQLAALYIMNWTLGCDGGLANWTSFHGNRWDEMDPLACVLSAKHDYTSKAIPTGRTTCCRRAQQDIELFNLLAEKKGWSRRRVARALSAAANLTATTERKGADDPGKTKFTNIRARDLAQIRLAVYNLLDQ